MRPTGTEYIESISKTQTKLKVRLPANRVIRKLLRRIAPFIDVFLSPFSFAGAILFLVMRKIGIERFRLSKRILMKVGVFPIREHYTEPMFNPKRLRYSMDRDRELAGVELNIEEQLAILDRFHFSDELVSFPLEKRNEAEFYYHNGYFQAGDAEYLYNLIRLCKPRKLVEVGSGYSTLMAINAILANKKEDAGYNCEHICIEPYERDWLGQLEVKLVRQLVEKSDKSLFSELDANDILFIDSSHIIRPQGDVLFEILEILPILRPGVFVHFHDVFTPKDYPNWGFTHFLNEQYLVEAFLSFNSDFKVAGAVNYLKHHYFTELSSKCPILRNEPNSKPGSFWIIRKW